MTAGTGDGQHDEASAASACDWAIEHRCPVGKRELFRYRDAALISLDGLCQSAGCRVLIRGAQFWRAATEETNDLAPTLIARLAAAAGSVSPEAPDEALTAILARQREWSAETFGPGTRLRGVLDHIRKELREVEANPTDVSEWIDVAILAFDGAWRNSGMEPADIAAAMLAKYERNRARTWPDWRTADPDKAIEHDRTADAPAAASPGAQPDEARIDHLYEGVAGHPDDDECTHRSDGTDETYCGRPEAEHADFQDAMVARITAAPVPLSGEPSDEAVRRAVITELIADAEARIKAGFGGNAYGETVCANAIGFLRAALAAGGGA